jgi:hypothetical protein
MLALWLSSNLNAQKMRMKKFKARTITDLSLQIKRQKEMRSCFVRGQSLYLRGTRDELCSIHLRDGAMECSSPFAAQQFDSTQAYRMLNLCHLSLTSPRFAHPLQAGITPWDGILSPSIGQEVAALEGRVMTVEEGQIRPLFHP